MPNTATTNPLVLSRTSREPAPEPVAGVKLELALALALALGDNVVVDVGTDTTIVEVTAGSVGLVVGSEDTVAANGLLVVVSDPAKGLLAVVSTTDALLVTGVVLGVETLVLADVEMNVLEETAMLLELLLLLLPPELLVTAAAEVFCT